MNTSASKDGLQWIIPKVALSPEQFEALSKSMGADVPIKTLMAKTLNMMIEVGFDFKIGAQKGEQAPKRKRSPDVYRYCCRSK